MKVIFLDIDGVLNCAAYRREMLRQGDYSVVLDPQQIARLKRIVKETNACIVLISSWRKFWMPEGSVDSAGQRIEKALATFGLAVRDKTSVLSGGTRSREVEQWLRGKKYIEGYVILDDNDFAWSRVLRPHWVCCSSETGLTDALAQQAIDVLQGKMQRLSKESLLATAKGIARRLRAKLRCRKD